MSKKQSLDQRIAKAEQKMQSWSEQERQHVRLQGLNSFQERMRLGDWGKRQPEPGLRKKAAAAEDDDQS